MERSTSCPLFASLPALSSLVLGGALWSGCSAAAPIAMAQAVDLGRFSGDWYVIASIPTPFEAGVVNAVESYRLDEDGTVATTFRFQRGFDAEPSRWHPRGFVVDQQSRARWEMQFVWPLRSDYRIVHVDEGYTETIVGREKRDYAWIMARTPVIPEEDYRRLEAIVASQGYDTSKLARVPQRWAEGEKP